MVKICIKCDQEKEVDDFPVDNNRPSGRHPYCRICRARTDKENYEKNIEARREYARNRYHENQLEISLRKMGLTEERYLFLLKIQKEVCAICQQPEDIMASNGKVRRLSVDHDRSCCNKRENLCGACVRGLLCSRCNQALGLFKDNIFILERAIKYLEQSNKSL